MKQDHIQQLYQLHLEEQHSIPMFLAAVISDMFSRQTFESGMGEPSVSGVVHSMQPDYEEDVRDEEEAVEEEEVLEEVDDAIEGDESDEGILIPFNYLLYVRKSYTPLQFLMRKSKKRKKTVMILLMKKMKDKMMTATMTSFASTKG